MMPASEIATLLLQQRVAPTPGQPDKKPMPIPLRTALLGEESGAEVSGEQLIRS
jgi:aminopeptidase N